jgi:ketosteroid isomerase-like protein
MYKKLLVVSMLALLVSQTVFSSDEQIVAELDAVWAEISRTVVEGDFDGMAAVYHDEAVLVNSISASSYPIARAMQGWKPGIEQTRNGEAESQVTFRFSKRLHDDTTAHETGIFNYTSKPRDGEVSGGTIHLEALLVKQDGVWKMIMEHQKSIATAEEWEALAASKH